MILGIRDGSPVLHELRAFVPGLLAILFLSLFVVLLFVAIPLYIEQVGDRVMTGRNLTTLALLTGIVLVLLLFKSMLENIRLVALQRMSAAFDDRLSHLVFAQINRPQVQVNAALPAQVLNDLNVVRETLGSKLTSSSFDVVWVPIYFLVLYLLHPAYALVALIIIGITALETWANAWFSRGDSDRQQLAAARANAFGTAVLRDAETLRVLGMVPRARDIWRDHHRSMLGWNQSVQKTNNATGIAVGFMGDAQLVIIQCLGVYLFLHNLVSPASFFAAALLVGRAFGPINQLIGGWGRINMTRQAIQRLDTFLISERSSARKISLPRPSGTLQIRRLTLVPPGSEKSVLTDVSFDVGAGRVLGIAGASGAGKSCLARALVGMWTPVRGQILLGKHDLSHWNADELGVHLGYMPQEVVLLPGTIAENIGRLDPDEGGRDERILAACDLANINDLIQTLPDGLNTRVGEHGAHVLSGGQRQRVALARAVYGTPRLVVLDEPNSNLDSVGEQALFQSIVDLKAAGSTIVVVSHKISLLNYCDDILVMNLGAVQAFGSRQEVFANISRLKPAQISTQTM
jgi:PrtD family type I secretion system ABC transporter